MPGTTARGIPYAAPTDPLVQWPATSQSQAEKLESMIPNMQTGTKSWGPGVNNVAAGGVTTAPVVFPTPFPSRPNAVLVNAESGGTMTATASEITGSGFTAVIKNHGAEARDVIGIGWVAVL